jgi:hypothetical protein
MNFFNSRGFLIGATAVVVGTSVYLATKSPDGDDGGDDPSPVPANCITMSRDQIVNAWLAKGWNDPTSPNYVPSIKFRAIPGDPIRVEAFPVDANCNPIPAKIIVMTINNPNCTLGGNYGIDSSRYDFQPSDVDPFGDLIYFNFMRLEPRPDSTDPNKLVFNMSFVRVRGGSEDPLARGVTRPCPPFCPTQSVTDGEVK